MLGQGVVTKSTTPKSIKYLAFDKDTVQIIQGVDKTTGGPAKVDWENEIQQVTSGHVEVPLKMA